MKKSRRTLAVVLCLVMILGLSVTASAAEADNETLINAVKAQLNAKQTVTFTNAAELVGFEQNNLYLRNTRNAILDAVPKGANLVIAGHSLGGMVAQQVAADSTIKSKYNVLNTVTYGSPLISGLTREGTVRRLGDTRDVVPALSVSTLLAPVWQIAGLNRENGGYSATQVVTAHCESYQRAAVWGAYDVTGTKNGGAKLTLDFSTTKFYASPVIVTY